MSELIAIVGRPNVGKSALFNRIAGKRIAIVHDQPGVTRDRVMAELEWHGRAFTLVDTGGIGLLRGEKSSDIIVQAALEQVHLAIEAASVIIFVVNVQEGVMPLDREVADQLRKSRKPVIVAANKVDSPKAENDALVFAELGFESIFPVTAIHGFGMEDLLTAAFKFLPDRKMVAPTDAVAEAEAVAGQLQPATPPPLKLAIVGRPNVGKSSIINALTRSERVIVSPIPGTTRDAVDVPFAVETEGVRQQYVLIDTAGVRREGRIDNSVEFYSVKRTEDSIARSDITVFVIDAAEGILVQDKKIAEKIIEEKKACVLVINKWDLMDESVRKAREAEIADRVEKNPRRHQAKQMTTLAEFGEWVQEKLFFLDYAPVIFTSAKSGFHLDKLLEAVRYVAAQLQQKVPTAILNRTLNDAIERRQPITAQGLRLKFFYATQVKQAPPTFLLFVSRDELFSDDYKKHLTREMRRAFGYEGCPIQIIPRARPKTIEPVRKFKTAQGGTKPRKRSQRGEKRSAKPRQRKPAGMRRAK